MNVAEIMRLMVEERKRHEEEIAAERRRRDEEIVEERRRRDEEMAEERQARARETDERMRVLQTQVAALERLAEGAGGGETVTRRVSAAGKPNLTKLGENDDIEAYLRTFERMMSVFEVQRGQWAYMLAPQLTGKAQKAFAAMEDEAAGDYEALKAAILKRYGINEEAYRQRLRNIKKQTDESHRELATRTLETTRKWLQDYATREEVVEAVAIEQLLTGMPDDVRIWVRERKPQSCAHAGELADDYVQARKGVRVEANQRRDRRPGGSPSSSCYICGQPGHLSSACPRNKRHDEREGRRQEPPGAARTPQPTQRGGRTWEPRCYSCGRMGHVAMRCPSRALYGEEGTGVDTEARLQPERQLRRSGIVNGRFVRDIVLDTGCTRTLVHQRRSHRGRRSTER